MVGLRAAQPGRHRTEVVTHWPHRITQSICSVGNARLAPGEHRESCQAFDSDDGSYPARCPLSSCSCPYLHGRQGIALGGL